MSSSESAREHSRSKRGGRWFEAWRILLLAPAAALGAGACVQSAPRAVASPQATANTIVVVESARVSQALGTDTAKATPVIAPDAARAHPAVVTEPLKPSAVVVTDQAINCRAEGCIASGPGCDTHAVPGQCSFPRERAVELCLGHPQCLALNCNSQRTDCQARDTTERAPWRGMSSIVVRRAEVAVADQAINCRGDACIASGPGCDTHAVPGQCSFPRERAVELCLGHPQCVALNCNSQRPDCQARDTTQRAPWRGMSSIVVRR